MKISELFEEVNEDIDRTDDGWHHKGYFGREATVQPLPKWSKFDTYSRNEKGTWKDIFHYMDFMWYNQVSSLPITGDEIADIITKMYGKDSRAELASFNSKYQDRTQYESWSDIFDALKKLNHDKMRAAVVGRRRMSESEVWDQPNPKKKHEKLSPAAKSAAKARAKRAGRKYPNLIDNMWASKR